MAPDPTATPPLSPLVTPPQRHLGMLVDHRDDALGRVLAAASDADAMDRLVRLQRHLAANNAHALREKAAAYARAAGDRAQTSEHLTPRAMRLLVLANLLGATQIEAENGNQAPRRRVTPVVAQPVAAPAPTARRHAGTAAPRPSVGTAAHPPAYFLVVSEPLAVQQAQRYVSRLASAGFAPLLRQTAGGALRAQVGAFATRANADRLVASARRRGLTLTVIRGGASASVHLPAPPAVPVVVARPRAVLEVLGFDALMNRGERLFAAGWYGPALASYRRAARTHPGSAHAHLWWGRAAIKVSRYHEARQALLRSLELSHDAGMQREASLLLLQIPTGAATTSPTRME